MSIPNISNLCIYPRAWIEFESIGNFSFRYSAGSGGFQFPFNIKKHQLMIGAIGDKFDLRVDNMSFTQMWDQGNGDWLKVMYILERMKRNVAVHDSVDPYKAKDYAQNYE